MIKIPYEIESAHKISETDAPDSLDCCVKFNHCKIEVPFTAMATDSEAHGRSLYKRLRAGEFGKSHPKGSFARISSAVKSPREISLSQQSIKLMLQGIQEGNLENSRGTPRGIVLVWSALLEIALGEVIRSRLPGDAVGKTLGAKIQQLKEKGVLTQAEDYRDLVAIKNIRNHAAHNLRFSRFEHLQDDKKALEGYSTLYAGYAEAMYHEVSDLLFVARFVFSPSCLASIERVLRMKNQAIKS
ncbi:hypothetical protein RAZWK3B_02225 [Roseobacter sp. AzwK-3b]|uniref:hypothetical protein n=1 Tax=Roseobacter sp. AzwK-3b TaxID=351016 RepID=UPI000156958C|nr:hypothetical protein [Roseobacter sp. AzwK-3b]EDM72999.1 hypothetical protein RAZWK3B_02225 [Roseobacter sp. AzwK-3b]